MSDFIHTLLATPLLADGAYGTYLFERTGRLSEANHVYEALNVSNPKLIQEAHLAYLKAGARCLTSNTFGANERHLQQLGEAGRVSELNRAGIQCARTAIEEYVSQTGSEDSYFILGSIGPIPDERLDSIHIKDIYRDQVRALIDAGADALIAETFSSLPQIEALLELIAEQPDAPPVVVQMSLHKVPNGGWNINPENYLKTVSRLGARVAGTNCCTPWEATDFINQAGQLDIAQNQTLLLSAMPNAGSFQRIGHRYMSAINPEFMGKLARSFAASGAHLIGGCCEVHPEHISEMNNYLQGSQSSKTNVVIGSQNSLASTEPAEKMHNGALSRKLFSGEFAVSVEMLPSRGTSPEVFERKIAFVEELAASGLADALDITDGSRGIPLVPPGDFIARIRDDLGWTSNTGDLLELIPHFTTRDLNIMGLQSRLMGYYSQRINNIIFITGDPPKMSPGYPRSTAVFDANSIEMVSYTHSGLNAGVDFGGQLLGKNEDPRCHFSIGTGFEPEALDRKTEIDKLERKIDAGADYVMTQPVFKNEALSVLEPYRQHISVLAGVMVLGGLDHANRMGQVPGVTIPKSVFNRLEQFDNADDQALAARDIAIDQIHCIKQQGWSGLYLMAPASHGHIIEILGAI